MYKSAFVVLALLLFLAGCSRPAVSTLPYDQMSARDFVAVVNGVGYTKGELERDVVLTEKILTLAGLPSEDMVSRKDPKAFRQSVLNGFVARELLLAEAKRLHVDLSPEEMNRFQDQFADGLSGKLPLSFAAVLNALGTDATVFRNNLKKDALSAKVEALIKGQIAASVPPPDPKALARERQQVQAANRQIENDNRSLFRLATNAWKSILAGNDFAVVGKKLPTLRKGVVYESAVSGDVARFAAANVGQLMPPTAVDGGLEIAKVEVGPDGARHVARLFFRPESLRPMPSSDAQAKAQVDKAVSVRYRELLKALKQSAEIATASL